MCVNKLSTPAECLVAKLKVLLVRLLDKIFKTFFFLTHWLLCVKRAYPKVKILEKPEK